MMGLGGRNSKLGFVAGQVLHGLVGMVVFQKECLIQEWHKSVSEEARAHFQGRTRSGQRYLYE